MDQSIMDFSMDMFNLNGKVAIITGGNTGLGMAYAIAFAKAGADVFIPHMLDDISEVKEAVEKEGRKIAFIQGNLTEAAYRKALLERCMEVYGRIDILVNNAGAQTHTRFDETSDDIFGGDMEILLNVHFYLSREVGAIMKAQGGGKIINIGSAFSFTGMGGNPSYSVAKHAVIGLTRSISSTYRNDNIQCNAICPGFFKTAINAHVQGTDDRVTRRLPSGKHGAIGQLMGTVIFLASPASDYISGTHIVVDGGFGAGYM